MKEIKDIQNIIKESIKNGENPKEIRITFGIDILNKIINLQERNEKAIEFIKENACYGIKEKCCLDDLNYDDCDKLLNILQGEDKDE